MNKNQSDFISETMPDERLYSEKLKDKRWVKIRYLILRRDDHTCQICGGKEEWGYKLHVHHIKYLEGQEPWEYSSAYLVTLCKRCHEKIHGIPYDSDPYLKRVSIQQILKRIDLDA